MNNNIQSTIIKSSAIIVAVVFLICSFSLPAFADLVGSHDWADVPITGAFSATANSWELSQKLWNNDNRNIGIGNASGEGYMVACFTKSGTNVFRILFISTSSLSTGTYMYSYTSGNNLSYITPSNNTVSCSNVYHNDNNQFDLYYGWLNWSYISTAYNAQGGLPANIRSYDGVDMSDITPILQDAYTYILGHENEPPVDSHSLSVNLPAGNAIIINISDNNGEALNMTTSSALRHKTPWSGNQSMGYYDSAPSSISTPLSGSHAISWSGTGSPNLFGGYNTWSLSGPLNPTKNYLVIVNPAYPNDNPDSITSNQATNGSINISSAYCVGYTIVPLSSYWNNGTIENESGNKTIDGVYDPDTQSWVNRNPSTGEPENPVSGGMTNVDSENITINDWLQNISHQIGSFFSGAIGAVSNLVSAGSAFINTLSSLYSWLPGSVYSVLSSALILVITIGVIKVFI